MEPGNKMILRLPFAHVPSHFAKDGHSRHAIDAINLGEISARPAEQVLAQIESWYVAFFLFKPRFPLLFRQIGTLATIFHLRPIALDLAVPFAHLLLAKLLSVVLLLQDE